MQTLKTFLNQCILIWKDSTGAGRVGIALLVAICVGGIITIGVWSAQPQYVMLASDIEPAQLVQVIESLEAENIDYVPQGSRSIMVDKRKWNRAKMVAAKLGVDSGEEEMESTDFWLPPHAQMEINRRNLQRRLENSIKRMDSIDSAVVNLAIPKREAFIREADLPTASVTLKILPKSQFNETTASGIANLVASGVPGLTSDRVSVIDTKGNEYITDASLGRLDKQSEFRAIYEYEKSRKVEAQLMRFVGIGNASVAVNADFNFTTGTMESETYDPESKMTKVQDEEFTKTKGPQSEAIGGAGTVSNVEGLETPVAPPSGSSDVEKVNNQYLYNLVKRTEMIQTPVLANQTVSVVINRTSLENEEKQIPPEMQARIESVVRKAIGLPEGSDQVSVEFFNFVNTLDSEEPVASAIPWDQINQILKNLSLGLAAIVALFISLKALKKFQPEPVASSAVAGPTSQMGQLSEMVKENPEIFSKIIASWSNQDDEEGATTKDSVKKAA